VVAKMAADCVFRWQPVLGDGEKIAVFWVVIGPGTSGKITD